MKILMVSEDIPTHQVGGLGKHVVTLGNKLLEMGHDVALMGHGDLDFDLVRAEVGFNGRFIPGFTLARKGWKEGGLGVWMPYKRRHLARRIERAIAEHGRDFDVIHYHGHLPMVGRTLPAELPLLQSRHDQGSECLAHLRFRNGDVCASRSAAECAACFNPTPNPLQRLVSAFAVQQYRDDVAETFANRPTIFVSDFLRQKFLQAVPQADMRKTAVIHNFIDLARLRRVCSADVAVQPGTVLLVGRMDEAKGFGQFLDAWFASGPTEGVHIRIVGDGPDRQSLIAKYGQRVDFLGWQPYELTVQHTQRAQVCVVPSVLEESCGTTILEALTLGRPCIALARGGTPELRAYERYPGQLQLAQTMSEMVSLTLAALSHPVQCMPLPDQSDADVSVLTQQVLALYERVASRATTDTP